MDFNSQECNEDVELPIVRYEECLCIIKVLLVLIEAEISSQYLRQP